MGSRKETRAATCREFDLEAGQMAWAETSPSLKPSSQATRKVDSSVK